MRGPLRVLPLRLSRPVARQGKLITVQLEAHHRSPQRVHGLVMLYYPAHLVSLAALHSHAGETAAAFPASAMGQATPADATAYQFLQTAWSAWQPGEQRRAMIALIPRVHQDLLVYISVVLGPQRRQHGPAVGHCRADSSPAHTLNRVTAGRCTCAARASVGTGSLTQLSAASDIYPVDTRRRVMEHRGTLGSRVALGQPFEGVIHHVVGKGHLIHREVAFEHTSVGAELLDAVRQPGAIDAASSSEPMGLLRVCQSKPVRGIPRPPSFM